MPSEYWLSFRDCAGDCAGDGEMPETELTPLDAESAESAEDKGTTGSFAASIIRRW